jgi:hypothetical protein
MRRGAGEKSERVPADSAILIPEHEVMLISPAVLIVLGEGRMDSITQGMGGRTGRLGQATDGGGGSWGMAVGQGSSDAGMGGPEKPSEDETGDRRQEMRDRRREMREACGEPSFAENSTRIMHVTDSPIALTNSGVSPPRRAWRERQTTVLRRRKPIHGAKALGPLRYSLPGPSTRHHRLLLRGVTPQIPWGGDTMA